MSKDLNQPYVGVECKNCGIHGEGVPAGDGKTRCKKCGQFGTERTDYCQKHNITYGNSPYSTCPYCKEERHIENMRRDDATRDPTLEPY